MGILLPYYEKPNAKIYSSGYPNTMSAMYTSYNEWAMLPIYRNNTGSTIKIDSADIYFGMNTGTAKAKLYFAMLNNGLNTKTVNIQPVSEEIKIPKRTDLTISTSIKTNTAVYIPNDTYFVFGFKADRNSSNRQFLSIARTNTDRYAFAMFNGQNIKSGFGNFNINRIDKSDYWHSQVPRIKLNYSFLNYTPNVDKTSLNIKQGSSGTIRVTLPSSAWCGWSYKFLNEENEVIDETILSEYNIKISNKPNYSADSDIVISAGEADYSDNINFKLEVRGYGDDNNYSKTIDITVEPIDAPKIYISSYELRPGESANITYSHPYEYNTNFNSNDIFSISYISTEQNINFANKIKVNEITDESVGEGDWFIDPNSIAKYTLTCTSKYNSAKSSSVIITAKHYNVDDIDIIFPTEEPTIWASNESNRTIVLKDNTTITGGAKLSMITTESALPFNLSDYSVTFNGSNDNGDYDLKFEARLVNDYIVHKYYTMTVHTKLSIELDVYWEDDNRLVLFGNPIYDSTNENITAIQFNPFGYPLVLTLPTTAEDNNITITCNTLKITYPTAINDEGIVTAYSSHNINYSKSFSVSNYDIKFENKLGLISYIVIADAPYVEIKCDENDDATKSTIQNIIAALDEAKLSNYTSNNIGYEFCLEIPIKFSYFSLDKGDIVEVYKTLKFYPMLNTISRFNSNLQGEVIGLKNVNEPVNEPFSSIFYAVDAIRYSYNICKENIIFYKNDKLDSISNADISEKLESEISSDKNKELIANALVDTNKLVQIIKLNSNYNRVGLARTQIAIGEPIMWNDSVDTLASGETNMFKLSANYSTTTASPYMELYKLLKNIQFTKEVEVWFRDDSNNLYDIVIRDNNSNILTRF